MPEIDTRVIRNIGDDMLGVMLNTDSCDREKAEAAVSRVYEQCELAPPAVFLWYPSPAKALTAAMLCAWMQTGKSVLDDQIADDIPRVHLSERLYPLPSTWRGWLGNLDLNEDKLCFSRRFLDIRQFTTGGVTSAFQEHIEDLLRTGTHIRERLCFFIRAEMKNRLHADSTIKFWQDTIGEVAAETNSSEFHGQMQRAVQVLEQLDDRQHLFVLECLLQFVFSSQGDDGGYNWPKFRFGQHEADRVAQLLIRKELGTAFAGPLEALEDAVRNCGWWCPWTSACIMVERPTEMSMDNNGLLHRVDREAVLYEDSWGFHALRGLQVPGWMARGEFDAARIDREKNVEYRRRMIDRYEVSRYLNESGAQLIAEDECGKLYRKRMNGDEDIAMVEVKNSTAEPDGTFRTYYLRVPPSVQTPREAVAWTFHLEPDEYVPTFQS